MNHALMVGSWWPQEAQDEIFANGDFRAASVAAPVGTAAPTGDGWVEVSRASGLTWWRSIQLGSDPPSSDPASLKAAIETEGET